MQAWRLLLAALVVAGLGAGLVYVVLTNGEVGDPVPTLVSAAPSTASPGSGATMTLPLPVSSSALPPTSDVPSRLVSSTTITEPPVVAALRDALAAWGEFAVTGRVRDLGDHFVAGGPQRRQLRAEAESIRADTSGGPRYVVTTRNIVTISVTPTDAVLRTDIEWARQGEVTQFFVWDINMRLLDGRWQLLTVEDVPEEAGG